MAPKCANQINANQIKSIQIDAINANQCKPVQISANQIKSKEIK
jgi:hypothetical protein